MELFFQAFLFFLNIILSSYFSPYDHHDHPHCKIHLGTPSYCVASLLFGLSAESSPMDVG